MKVLTIETFVPNKIKAVNYEQKKGGEINYMSVKFDYAGEVVPPLRVDGKFRLIRFKNPKGDIYSLYINCDGPKESFFTSLCDVVARESCRLVPRVSSKKLKPEDFDLVKDEKYGSAVHAKIYTGKSGKVKCRIFSGCIKNLIGIDELVDENFQGSCILKFYHAYIGSTKSITFSVEEIFVCEMSSMESYFSKSDTESEEEDE